MKPLLYADRQVLQILETRPFERQANGRWYFDNDRSIADSVAQRLIAHGKAKKIGDQLVWSGIRRGLTDDDIRKGRDVIAASDTLRKRWADR